MHRTGQVASNGLAYVSRTRPIPAANSASASGGITQYSIIRLVNPISEGSTHRLVAGRLDVPQLPHPPGQRLQRPVGVPRRRRGPPRGDHRCLLPAVQELRRGRRRPLGPVRRQSEPPLDQALADVLHRAGPAVERLGDPGVGTRRPAGVRLEQDPRPPHFLTGALQSGGDLGRVGRHLNFAAADAGRDRHGGGGSDDTGRRTRTEARFGSAVRLTRPVDGLFTSRGRSPRGDRPTAGVTTPESPA